MVVAKLVERLLPIPEVSVSNPVFGKIYVEHLFTVNCIEKTKIKKKYAGNGPFKKIIKFVEGIFFEGNLIFFKNGPTPASFCLFSIFSNKQYNFTTNICEKMSMQYTVPRFEPMTFRT